jgi:hypothetical protein
MPHPQALLLALLCYRCYENKYPTDSRWFQGRFLTSLMLVCLNKGHFARPTSCRYSIFGWWLVPGKLYDLYTGDNAEEQRKLAAATAAAASATADGQREEQQPAAAMATGPPASSGGIAPRTAAVVELEPEEAAARCKLARRLLGDQRAPRGSRMQ